MKVQRGIMFVSKSGWCDFYRAPWKGDISVMLYSSLWHFKLIKASNNHADWKDGGRVDTQWANTLNNAAIFALVLPLALSISSQFLSISLRWPLHLIVKGWQLSLCPLSFLWVREPSESLGARLFMCLKAAYMKLARVQINNAMTLE